MLRQISIPMRIGLSLFGLALFLVATVGGFLYGVDRIRDLILVEVGQLMLDAEKEKIQVATQTAAETLGQLLKDVPEGERLAFLRKGIATFRYEEDKSGYLFVAEKTTFRAHPTSPELVDKDQGDTRDKTGVAFVRDMAEAAAKGGGFVRYTFPKPGQGDQPKLSFAVAIPGTPYWVGTGVYIDNIDREKKRIGEVISAVITRNTTVVLVGIVAALLLLVAPATVLVVRSITLPLARATQAARDVAGGAYDLTLDEAGRDEAAELSRALNAMAATLRDNIASITAKTREAEQKSQAAEAATQEAQAARHEAEQAKSQGMSDAAGRLEGIALVVGRASDQLSSRVESADQGARTQAERVADTATAMEEMTATVIEVAKNAADAAGTAETARSKALEGAQVVSTALEGMKSVERQSDSLKQDMGRLGEQAQGIGRVLTVITDIADQTNLLALNAAIEAARAGDAGRGFAVVADEVRKLAEKTMTATKEVGQAIGAIQESAKRNLDNVDRSVTLIAQAAQQAGSSRLTLDEIVRLVDAVSDQVRAIATAAEEQSASSEEINRSVAQVNAISEQTSHIMAEANEAVVELAHQAHELQRLIGDLKDDAAKTVRALSA